MNIHITGIKREESPGLLVPGRRLKYTAARLPLENSGETGNSLVTLIDSFSYDELFELAGMDKADAAVFQDAKKVFVHPGGWQSWSAGWELGEGETLPGSVPLVPELAKQTNRDGDTLLPWESSVWKPFWDRFPRRSPWLTGHFIIYLRSGGRYVCLASKEGGHLPPVTYRINRAQRRITAEIFCPGKTWNPEETVAELTLFFVRGYFNLKDALRAIYGQEKPFGTVSFLFGAGSGAESPPGKAALPGGYESWYNHYTDISEKLILEDLDSLGKTENLIKLRYRDRRNPAVFQIDDGWEKAVGDWEPDPGRFPRGLAPAAAQIEAAGCIPGLWLAPFLVTRRSRIFKERPGWLLREKTGELVAAGYNPLWDKRFYCLDLSRKDVLEYLGRLMERVIDEWGFRYIKLDFLYAGFLTGDFAAGGSPYEYYERAAAILTARNSTMSQLPVAYLGCGLPLGPSYRRFPLSRIGADTREEWDWKLPKLLGFVGRAGAYINLMDTIGRSFMDGAVYINDPDVVFLRSKNCNHSEREKELIALVNFLLGGQIMFSDAPLALTPADIALTRRINALYDELSDDEYGAIRIDWEIFRLESRKGNVFGLINLSGRPYVLKRHIEPELFSAMTGGKLRFLTDHRLHRGAALVFAPHTITIGRLQAQSPG